MKLEDIRPGIAVNGILPGEPVTVVQVEPHGSEALTLTYRNSSGRVDSRLLFRQDESEIDSVERGRPWSFDGDGALFRLVSEAQRIRLAHLFDPVLAVHTSRVDRVPPPDHVPLKYANRHYGFSVRTAREQDLLLDDITGTGIVPETDGVTARAQYGGDARPDEMPAIKTGNAHRLMDVARKPPVQEQNTQQCA